MTSNAYQKFITSDGTFDSKAAMQAGADARTDGLRIVVRACFLAVKSFLSVDLSTRSLTDPQV